MTDDLDELEQLARAATPGPWHHWYDESVPDDVRVCYSRLDEACEWCIALAGETIDGERWTQATLDRWRADAAFIAKASPDTVLRLIERVRERDKRIAELEAKLARVLGARGRIQAELGEAVGALGDGLEVALEYIDQALDE